MPPIQVGSNRSWWAGGQGDAGAHQTAAGGAGRWPRTPGDVFRLAVGLAVLAWLSVVVAATSPFA